MGGEPYLYVVDYEEDLNSVLEKLRKKVFESGDYNGAEFNPKTPEEALYMTEADGTRSILDILKISNKPDYCCATPLTKDENIKYFNTDKPSVEISSRIYDFYDFWNDINRGMAKIVVLYENEIPKKLVFAGISFD